MSKRRDSVEVKKQLMHTFDSISGHFSMTRQRVWPDVEEFIGSIQDQLDIGVDLGCGNARHAASLLEKCRSVIAVDFSRSLLEEIKRTAEKDSIHPVQADLEHLPLRDNIADTALYIAAIHHLPTHAERVNTLQEMSRCMGKGAGALVSAWSPEHRKFQDMGSTLAEQGYDIMVPWKTDDSTYERFYHLFTEEDMRKHLEETNLKVTRVWTSRGNCYAEVVGG